MKRVNIFKYAWVIVLFFGIIQAQEFPIAVGGENTFGGGAAFDGANFMFAYIGDATNRHSIKVQFVSTTGALVGSSIALGKWGSNPMVAFDGSNFLVAWIDSFPPFASGDTNGIGNLYGQFITPAGNLNGSSFTIASEVNAKWGQGRGGIVFQDTTYVVTYHKGADHHTDYLFAQRLNRSGNPVGGPVQISETYSREHAIAFDGTNYLLAWVKTADPNVDKEIYGQFMDTFGNLVGGNFLIDGSEAASDNPVSMAFDGTRYWVAFHDQAADTTGRWNLVARFVSTSGTVTERFTICDSSKSPTFASAGFDGANYLITWIEFEGPIRVRGRVFSTAGVPLDTAFTVFDTLEGKFPLGGVGGFVQGNFLLSATRTDPDFTDGDVYGMFIPSTVTSVQGSGTKVIGAFELAQNYPNPFNPKTTIRYVLQSAGYVSLKVFDFLGREVATLIDGVEPAGPNSTEFDVSMLPSGVYLYRLQAGDSFQVRKMVVLR